MRPPLPSANVSLRPGLNSPNTFLGWRLILLAKRTLVDIGIVRLLVLPNIRPPVGSAR
jgi:hypothetical protein